MLGFHVILETHIRMKLWEQEFKKSKRLFNLALQSTVYSLKNIHKMTQCKILRA